ncbi:unnamed protein product [Mytilus edulis]|uniref:Uncharacterized protein n=1 Tax=Mytilus edulis TaxID=6550 RepID=A0A8S3QYI2_MYTED|nr:unnamed protein product [Mytilus edulis]
MSDNLNNTQIRSLYRCLKCKDADGYIGQKHRVEGHIWKLHMPLEVVPYYCTLCLFRCDKESDMLKHGQHFRPHQIQKEEMITRGQYQGDRAYIERSPLPYRTVIGPEDILPTFGPTPVVQPAEAVYQVEVAEEVCQVEVVEEVCQVEVVEEVCQVEAVEVVQQAEVVEEIHEPVGTPLSSPVRKIKARGRELEELECLHMKIPYNSDTSRFLSESYRPIENHYSNCQTKLFKHNAKILAMNRIITAVDKNYYTIILTQMTKNGKEEDSRICITEAQNSVFEGPEDSCTKEFSSSAAVDEQVLIGNCSLNGMKMKISEKAKRLYADKILSNRPQKSISFEPTNNLIALNSNTVLQMDWASNLLNRELHSINKTKTVYDGKI